MGKLLQPKWHLILKEVNRDSLQIIGKLLKMINPNQQVVNGRNKTHHNIKQTKIPKIIIIKTNNPSSNHIEEIISKVVRNIMVKIMDKLGWMKNNSLMRMILVTMIILNQFHNFKIFLDLVEEEQEVVEVVVEDVDSEEEEEVLEVVVVVVLGVAEVEAFVEEVEDFVVEEEVDLTQEITTINKKKKKNQWEYL